MPDCRVLVVEDDQDTREALVDLLKFEGYRAVGAANGEDALSLLHREDIDVVVLDLALPSMSGEELRARIKADARIGHIPVIVCSGATPLTDVGAFGALEKPFDIDALLAIVQRGCAARKPDRALSA